MPVHSPYLPGHPHAMLPEIYIEALLVDEEATDQVWEAWDKGEIYDFTAYFAWMLISLNNSEKFMEVRRQ